jgi:hypothetical protein
MLRLLSGMIHLDIAAGKAAKGHLTPPECHLFPGILCTCVYAGLAECGLMRAIPDKQWRQHANPLGLQ